MNLAFCVAALIFQGDVFIEQFAPENVRSPALARFAERVHPVHDPEIDKLGPSLRHRVEITVRLRSGVTETQVEDYGRGSPMRPLTDADVLDKFTKLVGLSSAIDDVADLGTAILQADSVPAVAELLDRLVPSHQLAT
jgi:2-methylcitrate dehydratase PrpD